MKTVLVTGGARRIGAAITEHFARNGWRVIAHYNSAEDEAAGLKAKLTGEGLACETIQADLSKEDEAATLVARCIDAHGAIDCLINNAALFSYDDMSSIDGVRLAHHLAINLVAPTVVSKAFSEQKFADEPGLIVNMLDQKIDNLNPDYLSYTLSKVGAAGLTKILALALAPRVRVCGIAPGVTLVSGEQSQTSFEKSARATPLGQSSSIADILTTLDYIVAVGSLSGQIITVDGGESLTGRRRDVAFEVGFV